MAAAQPDPPQSPRRPVSKAAQSSGDTNRVEQTLQPAPLPGIFLKPGARPLPEYELVRQLGRGGYGEVWQAKGPGGFDVALKFVHLTQPDAARAELRSLEVMKGVRHPHLLALFGTWQRDNFLIVAMELGERTLNDRLREARTQGHDGIPLRELLEYMREAAKGIDFLNERRHRAADGKLVGIQHKDVKPHNLLLVGGSVKVADFGLARLVAQTIASVTAALTPAYAAPECLEDKATRWSDQYSFAVSYCQLRGGRLPFEGSMTQVMIGHMSEPPNLEMLPAAERPVVARALAKVPAQRWPDCRAFVNALATASRKSAAPPPKRSDDTTKLPASLPPPPSSKAASKGARGRKTTWLAAVALLLLALAPLVALLWSSVAQPSLAVIPAAAVTVEAGATARLEVRVQRVGCPGPVRIDVEGLPAKVHARPLTLPAGESVARLELSADTDAPLTIQELRIWAAADNVHGDAAVRLTVTVNAARQQRVVDWVNKMEGSIERDDAFPGKPVKVVNLADTKVTDADLDRLKDLSAFGVLRLARCSRLTDAGLERLKGLLGLHRLDLASTKVSDAGLKHLEGVRGLRELSLSGCDRVGDVGAPALGKLTALEVLTLPETSVTDKGLASLKNLGKLKELDLSFTGVTDEGLKACADLKNLASLVLIGCKGLGGKGLGYLKGLGGLRKLNLSRTPVNGASLAPLAGLTGLETLMLSNTAVDSDGLQHLRGLKGLRWLNLLNCKGVGDKGLAHLAGLPGLNRLVLGGTGVTDAGLPHLAGLTSITILNLSGTPVTDAGLARLEGLKGLQELHLRQCKRLGDQGLAPLRTWTNLEMLDLWKAAEVTDTGLESVKGLSKLRVLNVADTNVTDKGMTHLRGLTALRALHLGRSSVSRAAGARLRAALPQLQIFRKAAK